MECIIQLLDDLGGFGPRSSLSAIFGQVTLEDFSRSFRQRSTFLPAIMAGVLITVTIVMVILLVLAVRRERHGKLYSRPKLFRELCQAHQLQGRDRRLLKDLAALCEAEGPELLFVRRDLLARAAFRWRQAHPGASDEPIRNLRQKLFAAEPEMEMSADSPQADPVPESEGRVGI